MRKGKCRWGAALLALPLAACMVGPDYRRPGAPVPSGYKELAGWKIAEPREAIDRGAWWSIYNDPLLDQLERQVAITNQNVKASEAAFRQAVALVGEAQANLFPVIAIDANATRNGFGSSRGVTGTSVSTTSVSAGTTSTSRTTTISRGEIDRSQYSLQGTVNWDLDVWGRIRRQIEGQAAAAQVSAADLANATLSAQATLATSYFNMRAGDSLQRLLEDTVAAYQRSLQITENQYNAGVASRADVLAAQAQLDAAQAQLQGVGVQRALNEHAIAVLTGHPPADLSIAPALLPEHVPVVPVGLPATLLERRPDIAAAERSMQQQNAQIGVAVAAYFPDISLSALGGFVGDPVRHLFNVTSRVWSLGAAASETLFNGGGRAATLAAARASYDESVASYRQTVLSALQQVEDELSTLRILEGQAEAERAAVASAQRALDVALNQYRAGTVPYTTVITQQTLLLSDQQTALAVQQNRLVASVTLIQALGGGWGVDQLPSSGIIRDKATAVRF